MEAEIQSLARQLLESSKEREPLALSPGWWHDKVLQWATSDPEFRVKLLRFVDVLPTLRTPGAVADHIRQYFRDETPALARIGSGLASNLAFRPVVSGIVRQGVYAMAERFIAGETPAEAIDTLQALAKDGVAYTVDLLGEATLSEVEADAYARRYVELIETLAAQHTNVDDARWSGVPRVNVSIKLSALCSQFEPGAPGQVAEVVLGRLRPLARLAREKGAFINVDMEQHRFKDLVHETFAELALEPEFRDHADLGIVVQAYLTDAEQDLILLRDLAAQRGTPLTVRLVKGAYWEEEQIVASQNDWPVPVWGDKGSTDASYERCTDVLLDAWPHLRPAFGTHNPRSIAQAVVKARQRGIAEGIEFQMLFGMAEELRTAVHDLGFRTRVYVPVGAVLPGMAYLVRRLLENTSNQSWFIREESAADATVLVLPPQPELPGSEDEPATSFRNMAPAAFHAPEQRDAMHAALAAVRAGFGRTQPLLIAGRAVSDRALDEVRYPADPNLLLGRVARATGDDVETAVDAAREAFQAWRDEDVADRAEVLRRAASIMEQRRFELAALMVYESAKPWHEADGDVVEACDFLRYYALESERLCRPQQMQQILGEDNIYIREGRGVAAIIAPWNFPLAIITGMTAAALAAGNCAIVKPAAQSPLIAARLVEILREAGVPDAVVQYLPGPGREVGQALAEHPHVQTVAFTGSKEVGLQLIETTAKVRPGQRDVKRMVAEMGGKNAIVIDDDADPDQAVAGVLVSAFGYAGQKCSACSRLIVVGAAYDEITQRLAAGVESLVVGAPHEPSAFVPPVISAAAKQRIEGYIEAGRGTAKLLVQGQRVDGQGNFVPPTVFVDVDPADRLARDEIFGPVLSVFRATNFDEALALAMDSDFALTGSVYSRNPRNIDKARRRFEVGNLYINRKSTGAVVGRQPFGGLRLSGAGDKAGGPDYLLQFLQSRSVSENTARRGFAPEGLGSQAYRGK